MRGNRWSPEEFFALGVRDVDGVMTWVRSLGLPIARRKALDFGCGVGRLTQALAPHFDEVCGVDIAPSMIELAKKMNRFGATCTYFLNGVDDLRLFDDSSFDFVISHLVLQHMEPRHAKNYLREFLRLLRSKGLSSSSSRAREGGS